MAVANNLISAQMKTMKIVYWGMAVSQVLLGVATYALVSTGTLGTPDYTLALTFQKIALILIPVAMAMGYYLFRYNLARIDPKLPLDEKLKRYFSFVIVRGAMFEFAFCFCCVAALVTNVILFLWIAPVVFFVFLLLRPTPEGITADLKLNAGDRDKLMRS